MNFPILRLPLITYLIQVVICSIEIGCCGDSRRFLTVHALRRNFD